ncbi:L-aspartate oxidase [Aeromicrobium halocynthiae]|uniref:L-aspartate oxidase n=1 Tax=Aeromicrobium halocynthiae TaxID=560557 RepID=A0ABN2W2Y7_9ACTN
MTRVVVVGAGVAGLTAALELAERPGVEVTLVAKAPLRESNTRYAQGGIAVVTGEPDTVASHVADTLVAGAGLSDEPAAEVLCAEGPDAVAALIRRGVRFDVEDGQVALGLEAAHAHPRILHAGGDATGAAIADGLLAALGRSRVTVRAETTVVELLRDDRRVTGVRLLGGETLTVDAVVLATGGAGQLYPYTTNPAVATGDGIALALRAGAVAADLEFYQFHPTSLAAPGNHLVSEAVRGEGAVLLDADGRRFMTDVHPDAELAPRDVVARGIAAQMAAQNGVPVRLDATAMGAEFLARRFPTIDAVVRSQGFDWSREPLPVTPAAHYFMGGVRTDVWGRTSVPGLLAVGEVACNGLHGANRLASNSLLEGAVYGRRVARAVLDEADPHEADTSRSFGEQWAEPLVLERTAGTVQGSRADLQQLMWDAAGLVRDGEGLAEAADALAQWRVPEPVDAKAAEDAALLLVARAVVASAAVRTESRGGHHRTDAVPVSRPGPGTPAVSSPRPGPGAPAVSDSRPGPGTPAVSSPRPGPGTPAGAPAVHSGVVLR